jgi:ornithine carbamoyltransferase
MKHLLRVSDLTTDDMMRIFELSRDFKRDPNRVHGALMGRSVLFMFTKQSTRTRISLGTAVGRLGGTPIFVGDTDLHYGVHNEGIEDTARMVSLYADVFILRKYSDNVLADAASAASIPVINALSNLHHPCQVVSDMYTLYERWGDLRGRKLAYLGVAYNVAHSLLDAAALLGMRIVVSSPSGHGPNSDVVAGAKRLAKSTGLGGQIDVTTDIGLALQDADVVYTDTWVEMGREWEVPELKKVLLPYQVNAEAMAAASPSALFMHCLPARRGEEVSTDVLESDSSLIYEQAANRLPTGQAILFEMARDRRGP